MSTRTLGILSVAVAAAACGGAPPPQVAQPSSDSGGGAEPPADRSTAPKNAPKNARPSSAIDVSVRASSDAVFRIQVAKDGRILIDGSRLESSSELPHRVRTSARARPDLQVSITSERDTAYAYVLNAIELVKQGGVTRIALDVDRGGTSPAGPTTATPLKSVPQLEAGAAWKCHIREDVPNLDKLSAFVAIHVGPDGVPQTVDVLDDPGHGLGESARSCAMHQKFRPATDASGKPTAGMTKLRVFFLHD